MKTMFVDFYKKHGISPVKQDVAEMPVHFERRSELYRLLGIAPITVNRKSVIEFGAGSGHNALYTLHLEPEKYTFVDGNPLGLQETKANLSAHNEHNIPLSFHESLFENFSLDEQFDLVLCEGWIPFQIDPEKILRQVSRFVKHGGIIVITTACDISCLAETLRKIYGLLVAPPSLPTEKRVKLLSPEIDLHLSTLAGRSRPTEDWVWDWIQPVIGESFSFAQAISTLKNSFKFLGSSPSFVNEWRWYKQISLGGGISK